VLAIEENRLIIRDAIRKLYHTNRQQV